MRDKDILVKGVSVFQAKETSANALWSKRPSPVRGTAWSLGGWGRVGGRGWLEMGLEHQLEQEVQSRRNDFTLNKKGNQGRLCRVPSSPYSCQHFHPTIFMPI